MTISITEYASQVAEYICCEFTAAKSWDEGLLAADLEKHESVVYGFSQRYLPSITGEVAFSGKSFAKELAGVSGSPFMR